MSSNREDWDTVRMNMCIELAKRSTCWKKQTASIIVKNNIILSEGYNGASSGKPHCHQVGPRDRLAHRSWSLVNEVHAEENAISRCDRNRLKGATLYTILSPCAKCAQLVIDSGITRVVFMSLYSYDSTEYLRAHGVEVLRLSSI